MHGKKYPQKKSHSQSWGPWSDWKWSEQYNRRYAERFDRKGNVEYEWEGAPTVNEHQRTPRTEAPIEQLTTGFETLNVNSTSYNHDQGAAYSNQSALPVDNATPDFPASPGYTHGTLYDDHRDYSQSHRDKGKGIANAAPHDAHYDEGHSRSGPVSGTTDSYSQHGYPQHSHASLAPINSLGSTTATFSSSSGDINNSYYAPQPSDHDQDEYDLQQALKHSRDEVFGNNHSGGSSNSEAYYGSGSVDPDQANFQDGETTPRGSPTLSKSDFTNTSIIRGTPGTVEQADHRFVVEHSQKFQPGEVFKILWSEPTGQVFDREAPISDIRAINELDRQFYVGYRRFIIVSTDESHHSTCVPILTYDRRGCGKKGVRPSKHGIIYAVGQKPKLIKNEPALGFEPVPLEVYAEGETLAKESRVNYSKLVTIEHNVKVFFIGRIASSYFDVVSDAVDKCWRDKMHKANKKSRR